MKTPTTTTPPTTPAISVFTTRAHSRAPAAPRPTLTASPQVRPRTPGSAATAPTPAPSTAPTTVPTTGTTNEPPIAPATAPITDPSAPLLPPPLRAAPTADDAVSKISPSSATPASAPSVH